MSRCQNSMSLRSFQEKGNIFFSIFPFPKWQTNDKKNDKQMTKKMQRNDKEMTKTLQKNDNTNPKWQTQMQKKCNNNAKKHDKIII